MSSSKAESNCFDQVRLATSNSNMPLASLTSVANSPVRRRRISSFGSKTLRVLSKCLGSWFRSQRIFGAVKPVMAGLATSLIRFAPAADALLDLGAFGGGPLVVPEDGAANDLVVLVEKDRAVHLAGKTDGLDVGRLDLGLVPSPGGPT